VSGLRAAALLLHLVGILFPHINDDARSKSLQIYEKINLPLWAIDTRVA
jgi:hypothetical protein